MQNGKICTAGMVLHVMVRCGVVWLGGVLRFRTKARIEEKGCICIAPVRKIRVRLPEVRPGVVVRMKGLYDGV